MLGERITDDAIYFWNGIFCQWMDYPITEDGISYNTNEQYMMAKKAETFNDKDAYDKIMKSKSPREQKQIGREVKNYIDKVWSDKRYDVVVQANYLKFTQHKDLQKLLLSTEDKLIVEASHEDPVWGIGLSTDDDDILDKSKWKGLNLLGKAIMEIRDRINKD